MNKLTISIDMGAKNNGVFIVKTQNKKVLDKKATCIIVNKGSINFSKKSRRENRHKDRNYKRRKLSKRLISELIDLSKYDNKQTEQIFGLLNNRGYTFISTSTEFEKLNDITSEFINMYFEDLKGLSSREDFENKISEFEDLENLEDFIENINEKVDFECKKKKAEFYKNYQDSFSNFIKKDLQNIKKLFSSILNEIQIGSKPRKKYFDEIKDEIEKDFDFIENFSKVEFFNIISNISNLQLRVLRKYFNNKYDDVLDTKKLDIKIRAYFKAFHYKSEKERTQRVELFEVLNKEKDILNFLKNTNPMLTIPPYEDMNNRNTYKCNSMLIKPSLITKDLENTIDLLLKSDYFSTLLISNDGEFKKESLIKIKPATNNTYIDTDFTYSKYLQRILDTKIDDDNKIYHPRVVFKNKNPKAIELFKKLFGTKTYDNLLDIATSYYEEETKIHNGIYKENTSIFEKCNTNTSYKNNVKELLLKPLYSHNFTHDETKEFISEIENYEEKINRTTLLGFLKFVEEEYKKYQNSFYHIITHNFELENIKDVKDKDIKKLILGLDSCVDSLKNILNKLNIKTYLNDIKKVEKENLSKVLNILKQTYNILFYDLSGFSKTCKSCTKENALRSDENFSIGKRLLSDVAKPIDGMLDMMIDRLAYEITQQINKKDIENCESLEILLEQNRFEFEENLNEIKRANDSSIKRYKNDTKNICPYLDTTFEKGEYDHILPQSKEVYNSKANMIYCSSKGNREKSNKIYKLEDLNIKHLKEIFGLEELEKIKEFISKYIKTINEKDFKNFDNLKLNQQKAFRYALFMPTNSEEYKKALNLVKIDKLKTFSNGTQKRLARFIYEKLVNKYPREFKNKQINIDSKTVDSMLVSATRKSLSSSNKELEKEKYQESHSHCIDAMIVFYLANSKIEGRADRKKDNLTTLIPRYNFEDIYLKESGINNLSKNVTFINSPKKEVGSYKLFDDTIYAENYKHITKESLKKDEFECLIYHSILFKNQKSKKVFINNIEELKDESIYKIDVQKVSNLIYTLFNQRDKSTLLKLKFLDKLQYFTSRKEIESIFFDEKRTKLRKFNEIKNIPYFSVNLYKAVYKKLENKRDLFIVENDKSVLNSKVLNDLLIEMFESKQKDENKEKRKRAKKRHKYTLPILGSPKFKIKRANTWQVLGNNDIATKNYIINGDIKPIAFFGKNTYPVKVKDLLDCLLVNEDTKSVYHVPINISEISKYVSKLEYLVTEAKRCTLLVTFNKNSFKDINFNEIKVFDGTKDEIFKLLINNYIDNKDLNISNYIGSIRDGLKAKAMLIDSNSTTITLQYKAAINVSKKNIILENLK
tara:strand:+ start:816 stop:4814 length:3999 start_codon:yes stop_codon:yes gene_type:complete